MDNNGFIIDAEGYHKALAVAMNPEMLLLSSFLNKANRKQLMM